MPYSPLAVLEDLGVRVVRRWLRDTWGVWVPERRAIVIATGLNVVQERCTLAHEVEHVLADDTGCSVNSRFSRQLGIRAEHRADRDAARKLIAISDLAAASQVDCDPQTLAAELDVTEYMLLVRLNDLEGQAWPATLKIAG